MNTTQISWDDNVVIGPVVEILEHHTLADERKVVNHWWEWQRVSHQFRHGLWHYVSHQVWHLSSSHHMEVADVDLRNFSPQVIQNLTHALVLSLCILRISIQGLRADSGSTQSDRTQQTCMLMFQKNPRMLWDMRLVKCRCHQSRLGWRQLLRANLVHGWSEDVTIASLHHKHTANRRGR